MNIYQHQIYELFFEVNQFQIKNIIQKCESFLSLLNVDDEQDDIQEEKQLKQTFDQDENKMMNKKQLKVWKNRNKKFKKLMVTIFFIFALIEAYFIFQYVSAQGVVETTFNLSPILNATSLLESEYRLGDNAIREYFINPNQSIYCTLK